MVMFTIMSIVVRKQLSMPFGRNNTTILALTGMAVKQTKVVILLLAKWMLDFSNACPLRPCP